MPELRVIFLPGTAGSADSKDLMKPVSLLLAASQRHSVTEDEGAGWGPAESGPRCHLEASRLHRPWGSPESSPQGLGLPHHVPEACRAGGGDGPPAASRGGHGSWHLFAPWRVNYNPAQGWPVRLQMHVL